VFDSITEFKGEKPAGVGRPENGNKIKNENISIIDIESATHE